MLSLSIATGHLRLSAIKLLGIDRSFMFVKDARLILVMVRMCAVGNPSVGCVHVYSRLCLACTCHFTVLRLKSTMYAACARCCLPMFHQQTTKVGFSRRCLSRPFSVLYLVQEMETWGHDLDLKKRQGVRSYLSVGIIWSCLMDRRQGVD